MGRISIPRTLLVKFWVILFVVFFVTGCSAEQSEDIPNIYAKYGELLKKCGNNIQSVAEFLGENTQNIVESSSDEKYVKKMIALRKETEETLKEMLMTKVPDELFEYHNLNKNSLAEYLEMLKLLIKSSTAVNPEDKKLYLDKAALKVQKANELAHEAERIRPSVTSILDKYLKK